MDEQQRNMVQQNGRMEKIVRHRYGDGREKGRGRKGRRPPRQVLFSVWRRAAYQCPINALPIVLFVLASIPCNLGRGSRRSGLNGLKRVYEKLVGKPVSLFPRCRTHWRFSLSYDETTPTCFSRFKRGICTADNNNGIGQCLRI